MILLKFSERDLDIISEALGNMPFKLSAGVIANIAQQLQAQRAQQEQEAKQAALPKDPKANGSEVVTS
jgi:hypothetical protein